MTGRFANIIVDISHEKVDRPFQYRIPEALRGKLTVGTAVMIPFGAGNKRIKGYVMEITDIAAYDEAKLKEVDSVIEGGVGAQADALRLAWWIKEHYGSTMIAALKTVLPVKRTLKPVVKKIICCKVDAVSALAHGAEFEAKRQKAKARLMRALAGQPVIPQALVTGKLHVSAQTIQALARDGLIAVREQNTVRSSLPEGLENGWQEGTPLERPKGQKKNCPRIRRRL